MLCAKNSSGPAENDAKRAEVCREGGANPFDIIYPNHSAGPKRYLFACNRCSVEDILQRFLYPSIFPYLWICGNETHYSYEKCANLHIFHRNDGNGRRKYDNAHPLSDKVTCATKGMHERREDAPLRRGDMLARREFIHVRRGGINARRGDTLPRRGDINEVACLRSSQAGCLNISSGL